MALYHGTSKRAAGSIMRSGLRATWDGNYTLIDSLAAALSYSFNGFSDEEGGAVIEVRLPTADVDRYVAYAGTAEGAEAGEAPATEREKAWLRHDIPPRYLRRIA